MGKVIRINGYAPKQARHQLKITRVRPAGVHENDEWLDRGIAQWVKHSCSGTIWYTPIVFEDRRGVYQHHAVNVWFSKRQDAMLFKLEFML